MPKTKAADAAAASSPAVEGGKGAGDAAAAKQATRKSSRRPPLAQSLETQLPAGPTPTTAGVVYVGHLPHGFYEEAIRGFFAQFGRVTRVRVARSKKTARAKGYAFVEFSNSEVARIVAETMNRYYLGGKYLVAKFIAGPDAHPLLFVGAHRRFKAVDWRQAARKRRSAPKPAEMLARRTELLLTRETERNAKLEAEGISYSFTGTQQAAEALAARPGKRPREDDEATAEANSALAALSSTTDLVDDEDDEDFEAGADEDDSEGDSEDDEEDMAAAMATIAEGSKLDAKRSPKRARGAAAKDAGSAKSPASARKSAKSPAKAAAKSPAKSPAKAAAKSPAKSPAKAAAKSPAKSPASGSKATKSPASGRKAKSPGSSSKGKKARA